MRKIILISFLILSVKSFSQLNKNWWLIGGNASFSYLSGKNGSIDNEKIYDVEVSPDAGYFFIDKLAGGLRSSYESQTNHYSSQGKVGFRNFFIAPFVRYYFLPIENKVNVFADASYGFEWSKYKFYNPSQPDDNSRNSIFSLMAGPAIFLNKHTALEITFGYNHSTRGPIDTFATNTFRLGVGLQIHIGKKQNN